MDYLMELADPEYVTKFQRLCGISLRQKTAGSGSVGTGHNSDGALTQTSCCHQQQQCGETRKRSNQKICQTICEKNNNDVSKLDCNEGPRTGWKDGCSKHINGVWTKALNSALGSGPPGEGSVDYEIKYKSVYYLAKMSAFLGEEQFFLIFFPYVVWNLDSVLGREIIMVWFAVMYLGQASKDFLNVPRPSSPPVVRLEGKHMDESAMPSTHAMVGTAMPLALTVLTCTRYQVWKESFTSSHLNNYFFKIT